MNYILFQDFDGLYWNPYNYTKNEFFNKESFIENIFNKISPFVKNNVIFIKGPCNINQDVYIIKFFIDIKNDDTFFKLYTSSRGNDYTNLKMKNNNRPIIGDKYLSLELSELEKNEYYSGADFINLCKMIAINLGFTSIECVDDSKVSCSKRENIFTKKNGFGKNYSFPLRFISLIKSKKTYYQKFNFEPFENTYTKNRFSNKKFDSLISKKKELIELVNNIFINSKWEDYFTFFTTIKNIDNKNYLNYFRVLEQIYMKLHKEFGQKVENIFCAYRFMNTENCSLFIDWLEIFHITFTKYKNHSLKIALPNIKSFRDIESLLNRVRWICFDIDI